MINLFDIKILVQKVAEAISSVLNMDVIISDCEFNKIADTKKHFDLEVKYIKDAYVISTTIKTGNVVIIESKESIKKCAECAEKDKCNLEAMICIPIKYKEQVLGAIGLIAISDKSKSSLLENQKNLIEYLNRMAELIVSKLLEQESSNNLEVIKNQMVYIINSIDEGIITIDENGYILYVNSVINDYFSIYDDYLKGKLIYEFISESYIENLIKKEIAFSNNQTCIKLKDKEFQVLACGKSMYFKDKSTGSILTFRKMVDVYDVINKVSLHNFSISFDTIIGKSPLLENVKESAKQISDSNSTVLILGESGTGKELFARAIHFNSKRKDYPFITLNCAAIPETLLESELFGYEEGTFTGAIKGGRLGKFQLAQGGTVFLDEIGDFPIHLQTKLLRVLQEKCIEKIGSSKSIPLDIRIIAATNKNLDEMVKNFEFREDLFYRLSVIPIIIPPLRKRVCDIKLLLDYFLIQYNKKLNKNIKGFDKDVETTLIKYQWPGNIRELENIVEYAVNMEKTNSITIINVPDRIKNSSISNGDSFELTTIKNMEKKLISQALSIHGNSYEGKILAAKALGIGTATLYRKLKSYNLD